MNDIVQVIEIFRSLQGESTLSGLPCAFVRLAGCNLQCRWCDTRYAVESKGEAMSIEAIARRVAVFGCRLVCITGGEPLLQPGAVRLVQRLLEDGLDLSLETNGSLDISILPPGVCRVMDVKCPSSGECGSTLLSNLDCLRPHDNVKFVIADRTDFEWALDFTTVHGLESVCPVLFSPAASPGAAREISTDLEVPPGGARDLAGWIIEAGVPVRLQLQLHRILWPDIPAGV